MRRLTALLLLSALAGCRDTHEPEPPAPVLLKNRIVFTSDRNGGLQLHTMKPDGSDPQLIIITTTGFANQPAVSPDGRRIAFAINGRIHVVNADGSGEVNIGPPTGGGSPVWSPDGSRIAFTGGENGNVDVYMMQADGSQLRNVTPDPARDQAPSWSPDGSMLAFSSNRSGDFEIWVIGVDGQPATRLTNSPGSDEFPAWSPDGTRIVFGSVRDGPNWIYVMNADGSGVQLVPTPDLNAGFPRWSPDGRRIVFECGFHVCVVSPDGWGLVDLTATTKASATDYEPTWSP